LGRIQAAGAGLQSLTEQIDTTTPAGQMMMQMRGAFAQFEHSMAQERTWLGLRHAREQGRVGGQRSKLTLLQEAEVIRWVSSGESTGSDMARLFGPTGRKAAAKRVCSSRSNPKSERSLTVGAVAKCLLCRNFGFRYLKALYEKRKSAVQV